MLLRTAICDDHMEELVLMKDLITLYSIQSGIEFTCKLFHTGSSLIDNIKCGNTFDVIFLDVDMPDINGLDTAKQIREMLHQNVYIIFASHYPEYMQDSLWTHPFFYMTKPIDIDKLTEVFSRLLKDIAESNNAVAMITCNDEDELILLKDIYYIEVNNAKKKLLDFHFESSLLQTTGQITEWEEKLKPLGFVLISRSILVNVAYMQRLRHKLLILKNGVELPVSYRKLTELREQYLNNIVKLTER